ncbi:MAG TPA: nuclear transport factor 2 family protein [Micromonosporaceae bacterium]|jgi:ketosteroid isomerase-like protein
MTEHSVSNDVQQIRQLIEDRAAAMRDRNAAAIVSGYEPDAVTYDLAPPLGHVGEARFNEHGMRAWFDGFEGPIDYEVRDLGVTVDHDIAFCHSLNRLGTTPRGASRRFDLWFRATVCLRRTGDTWLIAHEHTSTPFYMDGSMRAAVDLTPESAATADAR